MNEHVEKSKAPAVDASVLILDLLAAASYPLTLTEICEQTGIPVASGHRIAQTLLRHQLIAMDPSRKKAYCIGSRIFQIASTVYNKQSLIPYFFPIAEILKNEIHKLIFLAVPVGNKVVVVSKVEPSLNTSLNLFIGQTMPMHRSAAGKAILSMQSANFRKSYMEGEKKVAPLADDRVTVLEEELSRAHRLGYAVSQGEIEHHLSCIAAPVLNLRNEPVAAISACIDGATLSAQDSRNYSKFLIQAARQLSSRFV
ncbi:putative IclR family transcriptional regulator [Oceanimonas sp. GK1]|uniref:IclR family transcriptional regulator n=1 Tax=Oceanimonas sp. (strain GK1 / IBRC-M 10197) TaxID=511062 RepID=UPI0002495617|nr:IclR family transcriptional regulator [Oceanimonas sp. GK1]AEY01117.1 putative IclR family transcriptional regulator [Oceanimonas sp. GK1]